MRYGVIGADRQVKHQIEMPLPGPRLPHDMAVTEHYATFVSQAVLQRWR